LESVRLYVWVSEDVVGMTPFQMFHTAFIIPVHARVLFQPRGITKANTFWYQKIACCDHVYELFMWHNYTLHLLVWRGSSFVPLYLKFVCLSKSSPCNVLTGMREPFK